MKYLDELRDVIRRIHGAEAVHIESVPITETFEGQVVWDGVVEVFDIANHPVSHRVYAWAHDTEDPKNPRRYVTVLHTHPIKSARDAVRAAIVQEFKNLGTSEEN